MSKAIKTCIRRNMPETNSSSSHSISIYGTVSEQKLDNSWFEVRDGEKILKVQGGGEFGRYQENFNDTESKIQYACAGIFAPYYGDIYCDDNGVPDKESLERKDRLENILKKHFNVDKVEYDWDIIDEKTDTCVTCKDEEEYKEPNNVDHESRDKLDEIFENDESLETFLFSQDSWICCGEDYVTSHQELYKNLEIKNSEFIVSLELNKGLIYETDDTDKLGQIDFVLFKSFPIISKDFCEELKKLLKDNTERIDSSLCPDLLHHFNWKNPNEHNYKYLRYLLSNNIISDSTSKLLMSIYLTPQINSNRYYINFDNIDPSNPKYNSSLVPILLPESFKYPFKLYFVTVNIFNDDNFLNILSQDSSDIEKYFYKVYGNNSFLIAYLVPKYNNKVLEEIHYENI